MLKSSSKELWSGPLLLETGGVGLNPIACQLFSPDRINLEGSRQSLFVWILSPKKSRITHTMTNKQGIDIRFSFQNKVRCAAQPRQGGGWVPPDSSALMMERLHIFKLQTTPPDSACNATMLSAPINCEHLPVGSGEAYKLPGYYLSPVFTRD